MIDEPNSPEEGRGITRKSFVRGAAGVTVVGATSGLLAACGGGSGSKSPTSAGTGAASTTEEAAGAPKQGGELRIGVGNGSDKDLLDGQYLLDIIDGARLVTTFDTLMAYDNEAVLAKDGGLAESIEATKPDASQWTIKLRDGIEFHDGKTLDADDVVYSLKRIVTKKLQLSGYGALSGSLKASGVRKLDSLTVRLDLEKPNATIPYRLGEYTNGIVPDGYERYPKPQIGTGPYKLESFDPGKQSVHVRNPNYWREGKPYLDKVTIIDLPDETARINALLSGQVDAITDVPFARIEQIKGNSKYKILESLPTEPLVFVMDTRQKPFTDVQVRQAFRLIANRDQLLNQAISGYGGLGNDLYSTYDPAYKAAALAQRKQDLEQAKALLARAGATGLKIELFTWEGQVGMTRAASILAEQAKEAGVTITVKTVDAGTFFSNNYMQSAFYTTYWGTHDYMYMVGASMLPDSQFNETGWPPKGSDWIATYEKALSTVDDTQRNALIADLMKEDYETGGNLIPYFRSYIDAYDAKIQGLKPAVTQRFGAWDHGYQNIWFA